MISSSSPQTAFGTSLSRRKLSRSVASQPVLNNCSNSRCDHAQVAASLFKQGHTPQSVAEQLVGRALRLGSGDNVTVVAVQLNWVDVSAVDGVLN